MSNYLRKILIIGNGGSGKSTLSLSISSLLKIPTLHLDEIYWINGWKKNTLIEFDTKVKNFMLSQAWIIEGTPMHGVELRAQEADTIVFLDYSRVVCIYRLLKRALKNIFLLKTNKIARSPAKFFSIKAIKWVWKFNKEKKHLIMKILNEKKSKKIFHIRKNSDLQYFLAIIKNTKHTHA